MTPEGADLRSGGEVGFSSARRNAASLEWKEDVSEVVAMGRLLLSAEPGSSDESLPEVLGEEDTAREKEREGLRMGAGGLPSPASHAWDVPVDFLRGFCENGITRSFRAAAEKARFSTCPANDCGDSQDAARCGAHVLYLGLHVFG